MPGNAVYFRYSILLTQLDSMQIEQGSTATEYEEYIESKTYILNDNNVYEEFMKKEEKSIILWENSNPTAEFSSQTIKLSSNNYKYYEILFALSTINTKLVKSTGKIPKGQLAYLDYVGGNGTLIGFDRQVSNNTDGQMTFSNAIRINTNVAEHDRCVPVKIIGYKD